MHSTFVPPLVASSLVPLSLTSFWVPQPAYMTLLSLSTLSQPSSFLLPSWTFVLLVLLIISPLDASLYLHPQATLFSRASPRVFSHLTPVVVWVLLFFSSWSVTFSFKRLHYPILTSRHVPLPLDHLGNFIPFSLCVSWVSLFPLTNPSSLEKLIFPEGLCFLGNV